MNVSDNIIDWHSPSFGVGSEGGLSLKHKIFTDVGSVACGILRDGHDEPE